MSLIKCEHYDYIEIMCLQQYQVKISLRSGVELVGRFSQTIIVHQGETKHEAISGVTQQLQPITILLTDIKHIDVLNEHAMFKHLQLD